MADAAEREPAHVGRRVEVRDQRLQRMAFFVGGRGDVLEQQLEERLEVGRQSSAGSGDARPARAFV